MRRIKTLAGLKAIAMLMIFLWHSPMRNPDVDIGARMCELLFVCSGFLVGYNSLKSRKKVVTWKDSLSYFWKKLKQVWPLHFICEIAALLVFWIVGFNIETVIRFIFNALLLHAWLPDAENFFSFNGASWFLSALLFCYFMSPLLCTTIRDKKKAVWAFAIAASLRLALELITVVAPGKFLHVSTHTFPLIRMLEFYLGMLLVPAWKWADAKIRKIPAAKRRAIMTFVEALVFTIVSFLVIAFDKSWIRGFYVLLFLPLVLIFALDAGLISRLLGIRIFQWFARIQLPFYILHQLIISIFIKYDFLPNCPHIVQSVVIFTIIIALSISYNYLAAFVAKKKPRK